MKRCLVLLSLAAGALPAALAQSVCASDGQPKPVALLERFVNADCEACWSAAPTPKPAPNSAPKPARGTLALDWIVPGSKGDDAPLSAAASRDGLVRLETLGAPPVPEAYAQTHRVQTGRQPSLRVAHGLPFNDYIAASIELKSSGTAPDAAPTTGWLALVETIPAGTEGTPVERNLVRNLLMLDWPAPAKSPKPSPAKLSEARSMYIPAGAKPERLRVVGWVQDAQGRITSIAQSVCPATN